MKEKCVQNYEIDPKFENEFYDTINSYEGIDPSCSSGRQSRTYFGWWVFETTIPTYYRYFRKNYIGGFSTADYCPVAQYFYYEKIKAHYVGRCDIGTGDYGTRIYYPGNITYTSKEMKVITGETFSKNSFCYLSSLTKKTEIYKEIYSQVVRAICYETFCSSRSLTVKIHNNYIVCPRGGGKISAEGFLGYFLCPDYYLICSGTVLCNNIDDCVKKKSEMKSDSYNYDYEVKTSQNIEKADIADLDDENSYELSDNGICIKNCRQCNEKKICIKCRENYALVGDKQNDKIICNLLEDLIYGYYKNESNSIYYSCSDNCKKCDNDIICNECYVGYSLVGNKQNKKIVCKLLQYLEYGYYKNESNSIYYSCSDNCKKCDNDTICNECEMGYALVGNKDDEKLICTLLLYLSLGYYQNEDNSIYYKCGENCEKCFNEIICNQCAKGYVLVGNKENEQIICYLLIDLPFGYYRNESNLIYYKCEEGYGLVGYKENEKLTCLSLQDLSFGYYRNQSNSIYYKCSDDCNICTNDIICNECKEDYDLVGNKENNKIICKSSEYLSLGYYRNENNLIYYKCSENCENCNNEIICNKCFDNYELVGIQNEDEINCLSSDVLIVGYYKNEDDLLYYKCNDNCEKCLNERNCIKCFENYTKKDNYNSTCYLISELRPYYIKDPNDEYNFIKCSDYFNDCTTCDEIKCLDKKDGKIKIGAIIGIVIGVFAFIVIILLIIIFCLCKKCKMTKEKESNHEKKNSDAEKVNTDNTSKSEKININEKDLISVIFKVSTGKTFNISISKYETMCELIKSFFNTTEMSKYYGRKDLFRFICNADVISQDSPIIVEYYFANSPNNIIVVTDMNNLI